MAKIKTYNNVKKFIKKLFIVLNLKLIIKIFVILLLNRCYLIMKLYLESLILRSNFDFILNFIFFQIIF